MRDEQVAILSSRPPGFICATTFGSSEPSGSVIGIGDGRQTNATESFLSIGFGALRVDDDEPGDERSRRDAGVHELDLDRVHARSVDADRGLHSEPESPNVTETLPFASGWSDATLICSGRRACRRGRRS